MVESSFLPPPALLHLIQSFGLMSTGSLQMGPKGSKVKEAVKKPSENLRAAEP